MLRSTIERMALAALRATRGRCDPDNDADDWADSGAVTTQMMVAAINELYRPSGKVIETVTAVYREMDVDPMVVVRTFVAAVLAEHAERGGG